MTCLIIKCNRSPMRGWTYFRLPRNTIRRGRRAPSSGPPAWRRYELAAPRRAIHAILTAPADTGLTDFQRSQAPGHAQRTICRPASRRRDGPQDHPDLHRPRHRLRAADPLVGLQSRPSLVAQARDRHRRLLLVPDPAGGALRAHRPDGDGRGHGVRHSWRRRRDQVLRQRLRPARRHAALGARRSPSWWRRTFCCTGSIGFIMAPCCGNTTPSTIHRKTSTGSRRRGFIRSTSCSAPSWSMSRCCSPAFRRM